MRRSITICFVCLLLVSLYGTSKDTYSGKPLRKAIENNEIIIVFNDDRKEETLKNIILLSNNMKQVDNIKIARMIHNIEKVHLNVLNSLDAHGFKMKLFAGNLTNEPEFRHLIGVRPRGWSKNRTWDEVPGVGGGYVAAAKIGASNPGYGHSSINLELHELAHSVDRLVFDSLKDDVDFREIWQEEVRDLFNDEAYFVNYPEEFFAETFAMYYYSELSNEELRLKAPKTYKYIRSLEEKANKPSKYFAKSF